MELLTGIKTRRSIRRYTGEKISEELLHEVLEAGFYAPSAHNFQPWEFLVIRQEEKLRLVADIHPYGKMMPKAGCGILVCGNSSVQSQLGFLIEDCSAALENMLLAAHGLGLGAVWCGIYPVEPLVKAFSKNFKIPKNLVPIGIMALGYSDETKNSEERYTKEKVHFDTW